MVNVDRHIAFQAGWVAGPAFGIAMMAAPEYLHLGPTASAIAFWVGIVVFILTIVIVVVITFHQQENRKTVIAPIIIMMVGALIFVSGAAWYFWPSTEGQKPPRAQVTAQALRTPALANHPNVVKTDPTDIPKKLQAIDSALDLLNKNFRHLIYLPGASLNNDWKNRLSTPEKRHNYVFELNTLKGQIHTFFMRIEEARQKAIQYPDIADKLTFKNIDKVSESIDSYASAIKSLGESPNVDINTLMEQHKEKFGNEFSRLANWADSQRKALIEIRKTLSQ